MEAGIPCTNPTPHITILWADTAEPVETNALFADQFNTPDDIKQPWLDDTPLQPRIEFHEWSEEVRDDGTSLGEESA